jgi:signal transduction histidine kinase
VNAITNAPDGRPDAQQSASIASTDVDPADLLHAMLLARCRRSLGHEMKNSVQSLYAGIEILAKTLSTTGVQRIAPADCVAMLRQQLDGLQRSLTRILDDVAPEPGAQPAAFDLCELMRDIARFLANEAVAASVKLQLQLPERLLATARISSIRRVALGLCLAAIDAMRAGGTLIVSLAVAGDRACLEFRDTRHRATAGSTYDLAARRVSPIDYRRLEPVVTAVIAAEGGECSFEAVEEGCVARVALPVGA